MYGFVYKLTNMDNGKIYVGQTRRSVEERFHEHKYAKSVIGRAIRKHGVEKFMCEVIAVCETKEELDAKEIFFINHLKANNPKIGYNRTGGGESNPEPGKKGISNKPYMDEENFEKTGLYYVMKIIKGKYKLRVLYTLMEFGVVRFSELKRYLGKVSFKMLESTLKELVADNLIKRKEYAQLPLKVEYSLTERGKSLIPLLDGLCAWGEENKNQTSASRVK